MADIGSENDPWCSHAFWDDVRLECHKAIALKLLADPGAVTSRARSNLIRWLSLPGTDDRDIRLRAEWIRALDRMPAPELADFLVADTEDGRRLRQSSPFTGILTSEERDHILVKCEQSATAGLGPTRD